MNINNLDVVELTSELVEIKSFSQISNAPISDFLENLLKQLAFTVERLEYLDEGVRKVSLVAKKGKGEGGLGFFSHTDTVPGQEQDWDAFTPVLQDGRLLGRGSCDMKGPLAASIVAASQIDENQLEKPLFIVLTADEEVGYGGAYQVTSESQLLETGWPQYGIVPEPTQLIPVYAHKGNVQIYITAHGEAAHTSTERGTSANFLIAPFLAEMAELAPRFRSDARFMNQEFDPPTNGFNMVLNDGGCRSNVTAAKSSCTLSLRTMPDDHRDESLQMIEERAAHYGLEFSKRIVEPFYVSPEKRIVQECVKATGVERAETVPFGTEANVFKHFTELVVLGPGNIAQAHTVGEWIDVAQLQRSVGIYRQLIERFCL